MMSWGALIESVGQFGLVAGIAVYLIYFLAKELKTSVDELRESVEKLNKTVQILATEIRMMNGRGRRD